MITRTYRRLRTAFCLLHTAYCVLIEDSGGHGMLKRISFALALAFVVIPMTVAGQMWVTKNDQLGAGANGAPKVRTEWVIDTASVSLAYSKPSLKGRPVTAVVTNPWK